MTAALRLYDHAAQLEVVAEELLINGGELTPELEHRLAEIEGAFDAKAERVLLYARNLDVMADGALAEAARIRELADTRAKAAQRLRDYVKGMMERAGRLKVETPLLKATVTQNARPSIRWTRTLDEAPEQFVRITKSVDLNAAYAFWKESEGTLPPGFEVERNTHLRVK